MFSKSRSEALRRIGWSTAPSNEVDYIEAWKFSTDGPAIPDSLRHGRLNDSDIEQWLAQEGHYSPPPSQDMGAKLEGGIRLIISDRAWYRPPSFSMSKQSYLRIEEEFHLPEVTLQDQSNDNGIHSRYLEYDEHEPDKFKRLGIVIKVPQKYQIGNYALAMSHDFTTGISTGVLNGTGVMVGSADQPAWTRRATSAEMFELIKAVPHLWAQPMLVPILLLQHHMYWTKTFSMVHLESQANEIQYQLGLSRAGRLNKRGSYQDIVGNSTINDAKVNLRHLTGEVNTSMTELNWFCHISEFHIDCVDFIARTLDEVLGLTSVVAQRHLRETRELKEFISHLECTAKGLLGHNNRSKDRALADFNVLSSVIAQIDNRLNAKMAASSSRDSMAMKALAFITTLFLPGTFIATVFSMSMFNWQASSSGTSEGRVVSPKFWIYLAVTLPLTVVVGVSWRLWWSWEKRHFDRDVLLEIMNIDDPRSMDLREERLARQSQTGQSSHFFQKGWQALIGRYGEQTAIKQKRVKRG